MRWWSTTVPTTIIYTVCLQLQQPLHLNVIDAYDFHNNVTYTSSSDSLMKPGEVLVLFLICA